MPCTVARFGNQCRFGQRESTCYFDFCVIRLQIHDVFAHDATHVHFKFDIDNWWP